MSNRFQINLDNLQVDAGAIKLIQYFGNQHNI